MTVNDVDLIIQPINPKAATLGSIRQPSVADRRLTCQHFNNRDLDINTAKVAPHNSDARVSDSDDWPP